MTAAKPVTAGGVDSEDSRYGRSGHRRPPMVLQPSRLGAMGCLLMAFLLILLGGPVLSLADDTRLTENITVAEWRDRWPESSRIAYTIGAMSAVDGWIEDICPAGSKPMSYTVGDLSAYLNYTAKPDWKMSRALWTFWSRQCR
jgi:hypothetical protein